MKVFLHQTEEIHSPRGESLSAMMRRYGAQLVERDHEGRMDMDRLDAVCLYGSAQKDVPFIIALALTRKKPVLYLLPEKQSLDPSLAVLARDKTFAALFSSVQVTSASFERQLIAFLIGNEQRGLHEVPSIKFTLRLTPVMDRYLQWKSQRLGMRKADCLRQFIQEELIKKDTEYPQG